VSALLLVASAFKFPRFSEGKAKKANAFMISTEVKTSRLILMFVSSVVIIVVQMCQECFLTSLTCIYA